jgi:hypothetical protein
MEPHNPRRPSPFVPRCELQQLIDGLRAVASFYETHPAAYYDGMPLVLSMYVGSRNARRVLALLETTFGQCEKSCRQDYLVVSKSFGPKVKLEIFTRFPEPISANSAAAFPV